MKSCKMYALGIFVHIVFLFSIFDIYFKSPIVKGVVPYLPKHEPVSDRLVLFVVDGLRAESFVNYTTMRYLRSVANSHGRWGISNTQVPTESRPGHVAVIAGFYEDPSAVAKGWKENPVDFDSVFNQTVKTWCWGAYDIVNIFTKGTKEDHIEVHELNPYKHGFSTNMNTTRLDGWVFNQVKDYFNDSNYYNGMKNDLHQKKIVLFLHLLGTDTSGHTHKPKTLNYLTQLRFVDEGIRDMENFLRKYYHDDGKTTFLMTSDHGMTDWGSHGAGDLDETQTSYVIWGAGVKQVEGEEYDPRTVQMSLDRKLDINQVDLAPLMSTILSIPVPVNSMGNLPDGVLNMSLPNRAKAIYSNSRQLASQYNKKRLDVEANALPVLYIPFAPFTKNKYDEMISFTEKLLRDEEYEKLILFSKEIMQLSLKGLRYYHEYYQRPLQIVITLSFLGWIVCLLKVLSEQKISTGIEATTVRKVDFRGKELWEKIINYSIIILATVVSFILFAESLPYQYFLYFLLPIMLWGYALSPLDPWIQAFYQMKMNFTPSFLFIESLCYILGCVAMALSFTYRWMLSIPLLGMGLWPFFSSTKNHLPELVLVAWPFGCFLLSIFSFIPVVGKDAFIEMVIMAGCVWLGVMAVYNWKYLRTRHGVYEESGRDLKLSCWQMAFLGIALANIYSQSRRYDNAWPVSYFDQTTAWIIAVISQILPLLFSTKMVCRLIAINTGIFTFYLLLSVSHEGIFFVALTFNLFCWIFIEFRLLHLEKVKIFDCNFDKDKLKEKTGAISIERSISKEDFRRAFFFTLYIILAFFGTGNIASLNSFEVRWVTCFITSFDPFIITGLILLKTLSPFISVACSFRAVQYLTKAPLGYLNIMVLIYSNLMGILLLYNVRNTGSWLEIGTSISQFVIVQVITLFIVIINVVGKVVTDFSLYKVGSQLFKSKKKNV